MTIKTELNGSKLFVTVEGRLDTTTAPSLEAELSKFTSCDEINFDFASLAYISSAGLRVLLSAQKQMNAKKGKMTLRNVNDTVMEVFQITGFVDILTIE